MLAVFFYLMVYFLSKGFRACWQSFFILWFTSLAKDSGHAGSLFILWFTSLAKDSGHAGSLFLSYGLLP